MMMMMNLMIVIIHYDHHHPYNHDHHNHHGYRDDDDHNGDNEEGFNENENVRHDDNIDNSDVVVDVTVPFLFEIAPPTITSHVTLPSSKSADIVVSNTFIRSLPSSR